MRGSQGHSFCLNTLDENILGQNTKKCGWKLCGSYVEAIIYLQIYVFENKRNIFGFWLYCHKKFVLRQSFKDCGPLLKHIMFTK